MTLTIDSLEDRKSRGAFFTPIELADFMVKWAIRGADDTVLEPSCGDAVFLRQASRRLRTLTTRARPDQLVGYDIHADSLLDAARLLQDDGAEAELHHADFFEVATDRRFATVIGNPPFIRFQGFVGRSREMAIDHARRMGVELSGLSSSWAGFVIRASELLRPGGRLALVLPSELLSVNYAAPVRRFLLKHFKTIEIVVFDELVFAGVQTDAVVLLAEGFGEGATDHFTLHTAPDPRSASTHSGLIWHPRDPAGKWTDALNGRFAGSDVQRSWAPLLVPLCEWGAISSGTVTGANDFFAITRPRAVELGLGADELVRILPRGLPLSSLMTLTPTRWSAEATDRAALLFAPKTTPSNAAAAYIAEGELLGLHERYKTRIRPTWWRVPLSSAPDFFVSYMSASTPRIVVNSARARNLNSTHGLVLSERAPVGVRSALALLAMSSVSLMSAELVGRSYGGGILKMEPRETDAWLVPRRAVVEHALKAHKVELNLAARHVSANDATAATTVVDRLIEESAVELGYSRPPTADAIEIRLERLSRRLSRGTRRSGGWSSHA